MSTITGYSPDVTVPTPEESGESLANSVKPVTYIIENARADINDLFAPDGTVVFPEARTKTQEILAQQAVSSNVEQSVTVHEALPPQYGTPREEAPVYAEKRSMEAVNAFEDWYATSISLLRDQAIDWMEQ